jgi:general nucleoside transport system permease protein
MVQRSQVYAFLVLGATTLAYREIFGARSRAEIPGLAKIKPPLLGDIPVIGSAVFEQVWLFYAGIALIVTTALVLRYTSIGIAIHAAGAQPRRCNSSCPPRDSGSKRLADYAALSSSAVGGGG